MDALRRLDRIKHKGQHVTHVIIALCAGYFIALMLYIGLLFIAGLF